MSAAGFAVMPAKRHDIELKLDRRGLLDHPLSRMMTTSNQFCQHGFDLMVAGETAFGCIPQTPINASKFFRRRFIFAGPESSVEFKGEFGKFVLYVGRPCLDAFQNLGQLLGLHGLSYIIPADGRELKNESPVSCRAGPH
jgi:hypothetical protein